MGALARAAIDAISLRYYLVRILRNNLNHHGCIEVRFRLRESLAPSLLLRQMVYGSP